SLSPNSGAYLGTCFSRLYTVMLLQRGHSYIPLHCYAWRLAMETSDRKAAIIDTQIARVNAWRAKKRRDGYSPPTVWLKNDINPRLEDRASWRGQDLAQVLKDLVLAHGYARYVGPTEVETVHRIVAEPRALLRAQRDPGGHIRTDALPAPPLTPSS